MIRDWGCCSIDKILTIGVTISFMVFILTFIYMSCGFYSACRNSSKFKITMGQIILFGLFLVATAVLIAFSMYDFSKVDYRWDVPHWSVPSLERWPWITMLITVCLFCLVVSLLYLYLSKCSCCNPCENNPDLSEFISDLQSELKHNDSLVGNSQC